MSRYELYPPIENGANCWLIRDKESNLTLASISVEFPEAESVARVLYGQVKCSEYIENRPECTLGSFT